MLGGAKKRPERMFAARVLYAGLWLSARAAVALGGVVLALIFLYAQVHDIEAYRTIIDQYLPAGWLLLIAIISALLKALGEKLWGLGSVHEAWARSILQAAFRDRVASGLPVGNANDDPQVLAFNALYRDSFVVPNKYAIDGWNQRSFLRRVDLLG
jgi:hypothetical protein